MNCEADLNPKHHFYGCTPPISDFHDTSNPPNILQARRESKRYIWQQPHTQYCCKCAGYYHWKATCYVMRGDTHCWKGEHSPRYNFCERTLMTTLIQNAIENDASVRFRREAPLEICFKCAGWFIFEDKDKFVNPEFVCTVWIGLAAFWPRPKLDR